MKRIKDKIETVEMKINNNEFKVKVYYLRIEEDNIYITFPDPYLYEYDSKFFLKKSMLIKYIKDIARIIK